jgi:cell division initiation protein
MGGKKMKLTPLDIHHKEFRRAIRGYNEEDVDIFLDEVAEEFERLFKENIDLKEQIERTNKKIQQYEGIEDTLQKTLLTAQKSAEEVKARAVKEAELIIKDAEAKARETLQGILKEREQVQDSFNQLKKAEIDFRSKFRSVLESFLTMVDEIEGGKPDKTATTSKPAKEESRAPKENRAEGELARLLEEIKAAKNRAEEEASTKMTRKTAAASKKDESDKSQEQAPEAGRDSSRVNEDSDAEIKEIS